MLALGYALVAMEAVLARMINLVSKFWDRVDQEGECWLWMGGKISSGYGAFHFQGRQILAHRFSYQIANGLIPKGLEIDHLCRVTNCVRPDHLEAVTHKENVRRGIGWSGSHARVTHCPRGHEYSADNTYVTPDGERMCRACKVFSNKAYRQKGENL